MTKLIQLSLALLCLISASTSINAQLLIEASIENIEKDADKVSFEIFLKTQDGSAENLYLDGSDFIITFDGNNFSNPSIVHSADTYGGNKFEPMSTDQTDVHTTRNAYYSSSALSIAGNSIIINLNNQAPNNTSDFVAEIAQIDNQASTHSLGKFELSGIVDPSMPADLAWDADNIGLRTVITSLEANAPFASSTIPNSDILFLVQDEVLPTELTHFEATCDENKTELVWTTASEVNASHTFIQKSADGLAWSDLTRIENEGNSFTTKHYAFSDLEKSNSIAYYRLALIDRDGSVDYSSIVSSDCQTDSNTKLSTFPNPIHKGNMLQINLQGNDKANLISISDLTGKLVFQQAITGDLNELNIPSRFTEGMYVVTVNTEGGATLTDKLIVR
ncbi:MAG: T9SS type A sorting domain-containing protein [Bacteroidota bacterium]